MREEFAARMKEVFPEIQLCTIFNTIVQIIVNVLEGREQLFGYFFIFSDSVKRFRN